MSTALVWFRRDLRNFDHAAFSAALAQAQTVYCVFVFDSDLLTPLRARGLRADRRVDFIYRSLGELDQALRAQGGGLIVRCGRAVDEIPRLAAQIGAHAVYVNRDYEPYARWRDREVARRLAELGVRLLTYKDQVIFERDEITTAAGAPFAVFTPYARAWRKRLDASRLAEHPCRPRPGQLASPATPGVPPLTALGFVSTDLAFPPGMSGGARLLADFFARIDRYHEWRDYPARKGVSYLSPHLRFGTVSIRHLVRLAWERSVKAAAQGAEAWLTELIWREFFQMLLWHRPELVECGDKSEFDALAWEDDPVRFAAWKEGVTGYPLVDAAMRQLQQTGWMHNRLRMVAASFLTKDLGIDWRLGEAYFADRLLDYDLAANVGNWQWAAGVGADAQPWFRIFNPVAQSQRFDPGGAFIRRYVPELTHVPEHFIHTPWRMPKPPAAYPPPIVDHAAARRAALARYRAARQAKSLPSS
ncbi:MAG: DNA photolyase family protein [Rhodocyclaceae bacterium]|nr:DNA photolyase family protein [Rhodocyclaceae bacterium]